MAQKKMFLQIRFNCLHEIKIILVTALISISYYSSLVKATVVPEPFYNIKYPRISVTHHFAYEPFSGPFFNLGISKLSLSKFNPIQGDSKKHLTQNEINIKNTFDIIFFLNA